MNDKISLIIPFYNSEKKIENCIKSVLNQTYRDFEAIFINDGGTDSSSAIVEEYAKTDDRIVLVHKKHSGVSATRNKGLEVATGDYIQFLDSDDEIEATMLEKMLSALKKNNADVVVCNYTHPSIKNYLGDCVLDINHKKDLLMYCQNTFAMVVPWNKLYKREAIVGKFDETVHFTEDDLFALMNLKNIKRVVSISDELYHYYVAPKSEDGGCIKTMATKNEFWKTKTSYWYMRLKLLQKTMDSLLSHLDNETATECAYARIFDFMIWEILIMDQMGANREGLIEEIQNVFKEPEFMKSIKLREKYGLKFKDIEESQLDERVRDYVLQCFEISDKASKDDSFRGFYACLYLFVKEFLEPCGKVCKMDLISRGYLDLKKSENKEARYVSQNF